MRLVQTFQATLHLLPGGDDDDDDDDDDDVSTDESPEVKEENADGLATSVRIVVDDEVLKTRPCRLRQSSIPFAIHCRIRCLSHHDQQRPSLHCFCIKKQIEKRFVHIYASVFSFCWRTPNVGTFSKSFSFPFF